jgi:hypothetical protein
MSITAVIGELMGGGGKAVDGMVTSPAIVPAGVALTPRLAAVSVTSPYRF